MVCGFAGLHPQPLDRLGVSVHRSCVWAVARPGVSETDRTTHGDFLVTRSTVSRSVRGDSTLSARALSNSRSRRAPSLHSGHSTRRLASTSRVSLTPHTSGSFPSRGTGTDSHIVRA